jgi:hypothetical protein
MKKLLPILFTVLAGLLSLSAKAEVHQAALHQTVFQQADLQDIEATLFQAYQNGELSYEEAESMFLLASEKGVTLYEIKEWIVKKFGQVRGTVRLGRRCVMAYLGLKACKLLPPYTDEARQACDDKYAPTILNNCVAPGSYQ